MIGHAWAVWTIIVLWILGFLSKMIQEASKPTDRTAHIIGFFVTMCFMMWLFYMAGFFIPILV